MVRWLAVPRARSLASLAFAAMLLPALFPVVAAAQSRDFLFSHPKVTLGVRIGIAAPTAGSEIFDFISDELVTRGDLNPLGREDFAALEVQGELAVRVHDRFDVALSVGHSERTVESEFADWTDLDDLPIEQTTRFARTPVTLGLKGYLKDRGRSISRLAWVPYAWSPYLTAGAGVVAYDFEQNGDFVDFETRDVFFDTFDSDGTAGAAYAGAGVELSLGKHVLATGEGRYLWANADMSRAFVDFNEIDLSGAQITAGLAFRF
jgi:hypothetical protein